MNEEKEPWYGGDFWSRFGLRLAIIITIALLFLVMLSVIGNEAGSLFSHISNLIRRGGTMFRSADGFSAAVQLIAIAVFIGWALNRFMKK